MDFTAGAAGGTACVYCGQPLDTIKVKMQTFPHLYRNTLDCFQQTVKTEGMTGLYKGSVPALACNVSENAVLFVALGEMKKLVGSFVDRDPEKLTDFQNACSGSLASIFSALVVCPTELIKCRMQALQQLKETGKIAAESKTTPLGVVRTMIAEKGITSLFEGLTSTWAREMPGYFAFFYAYEISRTLMTPRGGDKNDIGMLGTALAGGTAGLCLWTLVFPIDVVKTRIQVLAAAGKQQGFVKTFQQIVRTEGFGILYSGLVPTVVRTYPANGALFVAYEYTRSFLHSNFDRE